MEVGRTEVGRPEVGRAEVGRDDGLRLGWDEAADDGRERWESTAAVAAALTAAEGEADVAGRAEAGRRRLGDLTAGDGGGDGMGDAE